MPDSIIRGFLSVAGSRAGSLLLSVIGTPILVRILGSSGYGDYAFMITILSISLVFLNSGVFDGARKYISEKGRDDQWRQDVFSFYFLLSLILLGLYGVIILLGTNTPYMISLLGVKTIKYLYIVVLIAIGRQFINLFRGALMGKSLDHYAELIRVVRNFCFWCSAVVLAKQGFNVSGVLFADVIASGLGALIGILTLHKKTQILSINFGGIIRVPQKELSLFNIESVVLSFLMASMYHIDIIVIQIIHDSTTTGYYKAALHVSQFIWFIPFALQLVLLHSSSALWTSGSIDQIERLSGKIMRYNIVVSILEILGIAVLSKEFVRLYYGPGFSQAITPLLILLPGVFSFALARPLIAIGQGKGELRKLIRITAVPSILNAILNILLVPVFGMVGAAVATSISYGLMAVFHVKGAIEIGYNPVKDLRLRSMIVPIAVIAVTIFTIKSITEGNIMTLVTVPIISTPVYTILLMRFSVISEEDILRTKEFIHRVIVKIYSSL